MRFLLSYIYKSKILWGGFEITEEYDEDSIIDKVLSSGSFENRTGIPWTTFVSQYKPSQNTPNKIIRLLEWGTIPRPDSTTAIEKLSTSEENNEDDNKLEVETILTLPQNDYDTGIGVLHSELVHSLEIDLPFPDLKKAEKVIPLQIQDRLPFDLPQLHSTLLQSTKNIGKEYRFFYNSINSDNLKELLSELSSYDLKVCSLTPHIFLAHALSSEILKSFNLDSSDPNHSIDSLTFLIEHSHELIIMKLEGNSITHAREIRFSPDKEYSVQQLEAQLSLCFPKVADVKHESSTNRKKDLLVTVKSENSIISDLSIPLPSYNISFNPFISLPKDSATIPSELLNAGFLLSFDMMKEKEKSQPKDFQLSKKYFPNLRSGQFRYRAPLTEIKNSLKNETVPFLLLFVFILLTVILSVLTPLKRNNYDREIIQKIAREALPPNSPVSYGNERALLESRIIELEDQLGDMSGVKSLSPVDWLYRLSEIFSKELPLEIDSISINTKGLTFRGTVPDYPTSGRISTILEELKAKDPERFCLVELKTDDAAIGVSKKQVRGEIKLCD